MKKLYFLLFAFLIASMSFGQASDLYFSMYGEGSSNNKWLEIYNGTGSNVDLSNYSVILYSNGSTTPTNTLTFTGGTMLANGDVYVIYNSSANAAIIANGDVSSSVTFFNGDDAIALLKMGSVIDVIGRIGYDPGTYWNVAGVQGTLDRTLVRKSDVCDPNPNPADLAGGSFGVDDASSEWTVYGQDQEWGQIGSHVGCSTAPTLYLVGLPPSGSTIDLSPEELSGELEFAVTNFNVDTQANGGDGYYEWIILNTTTVTEHDAGGPLYDLNPVPFTPLEPNNSYFLVAQLFSYTTPGVIAEYDLNANALGYTDVSSVADLRAVTDNGYYRLTTEAFLTFQQSFRGQKFIQDASGGILIDDNNGVISTTYAVNDGITNIRGQVSEFAGMKQLVPSADYGAPTSSANIITPQAVTLADLTSNAEQYESELVEVTAVTLDNSINTTFVNGAEYVMSQSTDNFNFRATFFGVDYITANVPTVATDIVGIVNERSGNLYFLTARNANDFSVDVLSNDTFKENTFKIYPNPTSYGYVNISSKSQTAMKVGVYDILGKQVINTTVGNNRLDVSNLTTGIYIMKISQDDATTTKKLVIK